MADNHATTAPAMPITDEQLAELQAKIETSDEGFSADEVEPLIATIRQQRADDASTTGNKYRAELYDEVWEKARALGHGNITEALAELDRLRTAPAGVPDGFLLVTQEQLERHATTAWECPPQSRVVLVSSIKRLHDKNAAAPAAPAPAAQEPWGWAMGCLLDGKQMFMRPIVVMSQQERANFASHYQGRGCQVTEIQLYTAPPAAEQPHAVKVPRKTLQAAADLLFSMDDHIARIEGNDRSHSGIHAELRALLARGDA